MIPSINDNLPIDKAELIAFFLESLLYGQHTLTQPPPHPR